MENTDLMTAVTDILTQLPILALIWLMFIKPMVDSHKESLEYYRQRQAQTDEWMRRLMEIWSGERLQALATPSEDQPKKKDD